MSTANINGELRGQACRSHTKCLANLTASLRSGQRNSAPSPRTHQPEPFQAENRKRNDEVAMELQLECSRAIYDRRLNALASAVVKVKRKPFLHNFSSRAMGFLLAECHRRQVLAWIESFPGLEVDAFSTDFFPWERPRGRRICWMVRADFILDSTLSIGEMFVRKGRKKPQFVFCSMPSSFSTVSSFIKQLRSLHRCLESKHENPALFWPF